MEFEQFKKGEELLENISDLEKQIANCKGFSDNSQYLVVNFGNGSNAKLILKGDDVNTILIMVSALNKQKLEILQKEFSEL